MLQTKTYWHASMLQSHPVDLEHLAQYTGGDAALNAEILTMFRDQAADLVGRLRGIVLASDTKEWRQITHSLKGAARGIGAFAMADAAADAEPIDLSDTRGAIAKIEVLKSEAEAVAAFINQYLLR